MEQNGNAFSLVGPGSVLHEGITSLFSGVAYGATSVLVGHPFDTIKTKMQADANFKNLNTLQTILKINRNTGWRGFYAGSFPPLIGSALFRSVQFASYSTTYAYFREEDHFLRQNKLFGVEARVFVGGIVSGTCRALIESPLDLVKTRGQTTTVKWTFPTSDIFRGFSATLTRNILLMTTFFAIIDKLADMDPFMRGGLATTAAWTCVWPLDVVKSNMQASTGSSSRSLSSVIRSVIGSGNMFRGYTAGITRSFVANGASLKAYQVSQKFISKHLTYE
jgi:solute carrier family 25 carnitine/acylcarnitine transporter 20/29